MILDAVLLSRLQFVANMSFHILFPTITMALAWILFFFKCRYNRTGHQKWLDAYRFWVKVFALSFALGVVSGITMSFQFGTNWSGFMEKVGNIAGPLLAFEVMSAFFLEATFLGIMLFGMSRVSNRVHTLAVLLVSVGTSLSAFWIIALNSWMQTPVGFTMIDGQAHATDWLAILFNPSMPYRFTHMMVASGLTAAFLIAGISAYRLLRADRDPSVLVALRSAVILASLLIPVQILIGDLHGLNTFKHQPAKVAAMEGIWETERGAPLLLFAWPDEETQTNKYALEIPKMASMILTHELDGEIPGLDQFENKHPPVAPVFWFFRIMVGMGILMLVVSWGTCWQIRRREEPSVLTKRILVGMTFSGWVATLAGWYVTEIGRQPYLVTGVLRTADAVSKVSAPEVSGSLIMYLLLYVVLLMAYISTLFYMARKAGDKTPDPEQQILSAAEKGVA